MLSMHTCLWVYLYVSASSVACVCFSTHAFARVHVSDPARRYASGGIFIHAAAVDV